MRCAESTKYTVMKALDGREHPVKFHEIHEDPGTLLLKIRALNFDDARFSDYPRRAVSVFDEFEDLTATRLS